MDIIAVSLKDRLDRYEIAVAAESTHQLGLPNNGNHEPEVAIGYSSLSITLLSPLSGMNVPVMLMLFSSYQVNPSPTTYHQLEMTPTVDPCQPL